MTTDKKHLKWAVTGLIFFLTGIGIISIGGLVFYIGGLTEDDVSFRDYSITRKTEIDFSDVEPFREWMTEAEITSHDNKPLEVNTEKLLKVYVESPTPPIELVVHIYHEDMDIFFTDEDDPASFRVLTEQLKRIPTLKYGTIFHIELDTKEYWNCIKLQTENCNNLLQKKEKVSFPRSGKYYAIFSAKIDENTFDHRRSPDSVTEISDPREIRLEEQIIQLQRGIDLLHASSNKNLGIAILGIGTGFMVAGISFVRRD